MKKLLGLLLVCLIIPFSGCSKTENLETDKITVIATLFPQFDFARQIGGDKVSVTLLLPPGSESHNYDPSPSDMALISKSDLFIYTGDNMEPWAGDIASSVQGNVTILDASENITLVSSPDTDHDHEDEEGHAHALDPHIWLDFDNAKVMCDNIYNALAIISPENESYFKENLEKYKSDLTSLDEKYKETISQSDKTIVFGGKFALGYLVRRYNINYLSAYDSCSANAEPSIADISRLSAFVSENDIKAVFCQEYTDPKVAREIANANNAEVLVLHSCHNISKDEREMGTTFVYLMEKNLENLSKGLS
ncbi:MAG: metal ABC transporter substrate-binding protein [Clostridia bacterium]